jgi:hypothetical protein
MNREDIIRMAREIIPNNAAFELNGLSEIERFASLVAAAEREACAVECELLDMDYVTEDDWTIAREMARVECAEAIRKRGEK